MLSYEPSHGIYIPTAFNIEGFPRMNIAMPTKNTSMVWLPF